MNFIKRPNLPTKAVKYVVCDSRTESAVIKELKSLGINVIYVPESKHLQNPVSAHPDMHLFYVGNGSFYSSKEYCEIFTTQIEALNIDCELFNNTAICGYLKENYPYDVPLNGVTVGEYLICNTKTIAEEILQGTSKKIISINQGYTKCSTCVVCESAIITDDPSIAKAVKGKIDVLYLEHSEIKLNGYNYGFIGGCSGKLSNDVLAFSGSIEKLSYGNTIKSFCSNHRVNCMSLSDSQLYDYGSILPIIE